LNIISGLTPLDVNGISFSGTIAPMIPFCPCDVANLSPSSGILRSLVFTLTTLFPCESSVIKTASTIPCSSCLITDDASFFAFIENFSYF